MSVKVTKDNVSNVLKSINELVRKDVLVGIPDSAPERTDTEITNAQIGYIQETGSPANNIPARPFLVPGVNGAQAPIAEQLGKGAKAALSGNASAAEKSMHSAGIVAQNAVRGKITAGPFEPLAESTLYARRQRGRTGTRPLIDTGQLRSSITYVVRDK